jgi:hypothetical protein
VKCISNAIFQADEFGKRVVKKRLKLHEYKICTKILDERTGCGDPCCGAGKAELSKFDHVDTRCKLQLREYDVANICLAEEARYSILIVLSRN